MTTQCPTRPSLRSYAFGKLEDAQSHKIDQHLSDCPSCQTELDTLCDHDDSFVASLQLGENAEVPSGDFAGEPSCSTAVARALAALSMAEESGDGEYPIAIGQYEIIRPLGQGGMGSVYLARQNRLDRLVALKVIRSGRAFDKRASQRFDTEMQAIGRLSHPNIVVAHDAREIDGEAVLVMEYIDGIDLSQLMRALPGPLSVADTCKAGQQVAVALQYAGDQGFVHRDVKPGNIMLDRQGRVKLLDLGLARLTSDRQAAQGSANGISDAAYSDVALTATGQPLGTADYIAPEQVSDSKSVSRAADIYSLGCTLYRMLSGSVPFSSRSHGTTFSKMAAHVSETPISLASLTPNVPRPVAKLIGTMMDKQPANRPSAERVATELAKYSSAANLESLVQSALAIDGAAVPENGDSGNTDRRLAAVSKRRASRWRTAVGCTVGGLLLGIVATIVVSIYGPDGSLLAQVKTEDGGRVVIEESAGGAGPSSQRQVVAPQLPASSSAAVVDESAESAPLVFALVAKVGDDPDATISKDQFDALSRELAKTDGTKRVRTEGSEFFPEGDVENLDIAEAWTGGKRFVLLDMSQDGSIHWREIAGHILNLETKQGVSGRYELLLTFDKTLSSRLEKLTGNHLGRHLAIASGGKLVMAPIINGKISGKCTITGDWDTATFMQLQQTLAAAQLAGDPQAQTNATSRPQNIRAALDILAQNVGKDIDQTEVASALEMLHPGDTQKANKRYAAALKRHNVFGAVRFLSGEPDEKSGWIRNADQCMIYRFEVDWHRLFDTLAGFVNDLAGKDDVFQSLVAGIKLDPNGPQVDLLKVVENLNKHVFVLHDDSDDARIAVAISVDDASLVQKAVEKSVNRDPNVLIVSRGSQPAYMSKSPIFGPITTLVTDGYFLIGDPFLVRQTEEWITSKSHRAGARAEDFGDFGKYGESTRP